MSNSTLKCKSLKTSFSDNCIRNIFATIRLQSFSTNINENEVCTKKINQIFKKIKTHSPSYIKMNFGCITDKLFCNRKSFM